MVRLFDTQMKLIYSSYRLFNVLSNLDTDKIIYSSPRNVTIVIVGVCVFAHRKWFTHAQVFNVKGSIGDTVFTTNFRLNSDILSRDYTTESLSVTNDKRDS